MVFERSWKELCGEKESIKECRGSGSKEVSMGEASVDADRFLQTSVLKEGYVRKKLVHQN